MGNKATITREQILAAAYGIVTEHGLAGLGVREVAQACEVSVGSVYNYFPTKADLVSDVVGMFWENSLAKEALHPRPNEGFLPFCRRLCATIEQMFGKFRSGWLEQAKALDAKSLAMARERENACFGHIERGLAALLRSDPSIDQGVLTGALDPDALGILVWRVIFNSLRQGDNSHQTLLALLEQALDPLAGTSSESAPAKGASEPASGRPAHGLEAR